MPPPQAPLPGPAPAAPPEATARLSDSSRTAPSPSPRSGLPSPRAPSPVAARWLHRPRPPHRRPSSSPCSHLRCHSRARTLPHRRLAKPDASRRHRRHQAPPRVRCPAAELRRRICTSPPPVSSSPPLSLLFPDPIWIGKGQRARRRPASEAARPRRHTAPKSPRLPDAASPDRPSSSSSTTGLLTPRRPASLQRW